MLLVIAVVVTPVDNNTGRETVALAQQIRVGQFSCVVGRAWYNAQSSAIAGISSDNNRANRRCQCPPIRCRRNASSASSENHVCGEAEIPACFQKRLSSRSCLVPSNH